MKKEKEKSKNSITEKNFPHYIPIIVLFLTGLAVYSGAFMKGIFLFDDQALIIDNSFIKNFSHIKTIFTMPLFKGIETSNFYRPMQTLSSMVEYHFWGLRPFGYHFVNVIIHILTSIAVYFFGYILSKRQIVGITAGLLFSVHTVLSGPVYYISARADLLMALFFVTALNFYVLYKETKTHGLLFYSISFLSFLAAILSKETAVMAPFLILFYLYCFSGKRLDPENSKPNLLWPFFIVIAVYGWLRFTALDFSRGRFIETTTAVVPMYIRLLTTSKVLMIYLRLMVLPVGLHMEWDIKPAASFMQDEVFLSVIGLLIIAGVVYYLSQKSKLKFFAIGWFLIALIPYSNIYPLAYFMGEGWLYVPSIGFFILMAIYLSELRKKSRAWSLTVTSMIVFLILFYGILTFKRADVWADPVKLYKEILKYSPNNTKARINLGVFLAKSGVNKESIEKFKEVIQLDPNNSEAHINLGFAYFGKGMYDMALEEYKKAGSESYIVHVNMGAVYEKKGDIKKAIEEYKKALELNPNDPKAKNGLGAILAKSGSDEEAIKKFKEAAQLAPDDSMAHINLSEAYVKKGAYDTALEEFKKAVELNPKDHVAHMNIGIIYKKKGDIKKAMEEYEKALELDPSYPLTYNNIGNIHLESGQYDDAIKFYKKAISIDPYNAGFYGNLGKAYKNKEMPKEAQESFEKALSLDPNNKDALEGLNAVK